MWQNILIISLTAYLALSILRRFYLRNWHVFHGQTVLECDAEKLEHRLHYPKPWSGLRTMKVRDLSFFNHRI